MKKFRTFATSMFLTLLLIPSKVFADGGYHDDGGDAFGELFALIGWLIVIVLGIVVALIILAGILGLLEKLGVIKLPPAPPAR